MTLKLALPGPGWTGLGSHELPAKVDSHRAAIPRAPPAAVHKAEERTFHETKHLLFLCLYCRKAAPERRLLLCGSRELCKSHFVLLPVLPYQASCACQPCTPQGQPHPHPLPAAEGFPDFTASFTCLTRLKQLLLAGNALTALPQGLQLPLLEQADLQRNSFRCDYWTHQLLAAAAVAVLADHERMCAAHVTGPQCGLQAF